MAHEHGNHLCYCPSCNAQFEVAEYTKCNTLPCPDCGSLLRALETGEFRTSKIRSEGNVVPIDDQPMDAAFFDQARRLTDFITPDALEVQSLYNEITEGIHGTVEKLTACWEWVASQVKYVESVRGKLSINDQTDVQKDLWTLPELTIRTRIGNCAIKSFLLTSLLRNELAPDQVYCVLGNLYNGKPGGHAWVAVRMPEEYIMESTNPNLPPLVPAVAAERYESVHYFNDTEILAVEGKTQLVPMTTCYSTWLSDYLNWVYIESQRG